MLRLLMLPVILCATIGQVGHAKEDVNVPGLKIGEKAPGFKLVSQSGKAVELTEVLKKGAVAIVFHRSAAW